jgi:hypothetical protein
MLGRVGWLPVLVAGGFAWDVPGQIRNASFHRAATRFIARVDRE